MRHETASHTQKKAKTKQAKMHVLRSHTGLQTRDRGWAWGSGSECLLGHSAAQSGVRAPGCGGLSSGVGNTPTGKGGKDPEEGSAEGWLWDPPREEQEVQAVPGCQEPWGGQDPPAGKPPSRSCSFCDHQDSPGGCGGLGRRCPDAPGKSLTAPAMQLPCIPSLGPGSCLGKRPPVISLPCGLGHLCPCKVSDPPDLCPLLVL